MTGTINESVAIARHVLGTAGDDEAALVAELALPEDALPTAEQAAWTVLELLIGEIAHGTVEPEPGLTRVVDEVFRSAGLSAGLVGGRMRGRMGESHNAARLVAFVDEYDDIRRYERRSGSTDLRRAQVDAQVITLARDWMRGNATFRVL